MHILHTSDGTPSLGSAGSLSSSFAAFVFAVGGAAVTSHLVFDHQPPSQPEDVATYLATLGAAVIAGWWLANVIAWSAALRRGVQLDRFTLPGTKRIAQIVLAATLSTSCVADASSDPVMVLVEQAEGSSSTTASSPTTSAPILSPSTTAPPTTQPIMTSPPETVPSEVASAEPSEQAIEIAEVPLMIDSHQVVVNEGDNLWSLSAEALASHGVGQPSTGHVAAYWRLVVTANQVRSGNPDLITPGETITMPAFDLSSFEPALTQPTAPTNGIGAR